MATGLRSSMMSLSSQVDLDLRQVFTQVGTYKKGIVAVKRVNKKNVDLTRNVRKELKVVHEISFILFTLLGKHDLLEMVIYGHSIN